ncbi:polysaccharide biosynthesis tyrosine autokinase [Brachybacterium sp. AOP29-B2-41]|uniref:polysaccharide biosynthesis tyrosine autokinase n=1 Tax=Brachybacterium sp. AOP29-B2-41 TaxID=3457704 RepID=UPI00403370A3
MSESRITLGLIVGALRKLWWVVVVSGALGAVATYGYASLQTPQFQSTTSLHFAMAQGSSASDLKQGSEYTQGQMLSYAQLVEGSLVLDPVIEELDLDTTSRELARSIEVAIPQDTATMRITATTSDPQRSADLATAVSEQLISVVHGTSAAGENGSASITVTIFDSAVPPQFQSSPDKTRDGLLGGVLGGIVGVALALLIALLDTRVRNEEILTEAGGDPVLGVVTKSPLLASRVIAVAQEPLSATAEEFQRIRSALTFANVNSRVRVLLVTAGMPGEGKSTVSVNLAMTLAGQQRSVLLIDADLRRPRVHEHAGIDGVVGLTSVLVGEVDVGVATHTVRGTTLDVLPAGEIPPNPAELLTSHRMEELIASVSDRYSYIVVDTPPILSVADTNLLLPLADGVILVVDAGRTRRAALAKSLRSLETGGGRILGTVLNRARRERRREPYYSDSPADS